MGTNQGIVVSVAICNLHAMAEGARLTCLYVESKESRDTFGLLLPIVCGVAWNVLTRLGGLDRVLYSVSCGWRKPSNGASARETAVQGSCL